MNADLIIYGNAMFQATGRDDLPVAGGVAIKGDTIIAVGTKEELDACLAENTRVIACGENTLIMPAINDGHQHLRCIISSFNGVSLRYVTSEQKCIENALTWEKEHPEIEWVFGFGWQYNNWEDKIPPNNKLLNEAFPNKPVCLVDTDFHGAWLNDCALREFGITQNSPDPEGSVIARYADGTPTGYVQEAIILDIADKAMGAMETSPQLMKSNLRKLLRECNEYGITGVSEMLGSKPEWLDVYEEMASEDALTCRIVLTQDFWPEDYLQNTEKLAKRFPDNKSNVYFYAIKCFFDGVGIGHTSWQLHPFHDKPDWSGEPMIPEEILRQETLTAIASGQHIHIHACGDKSVRKALDWWEEAQNKGLTKPRQRYTITHNDTVDPQDIPRFAKLGVVASMQPDMLAPCLKWEDNLYPSRYGEKLSQTAWPCRSFIDSGVVLAFSTDAPVGLLDPMMNIYRAVTRLHADGKPEGGWIPEQKISLANALWAYTYGSAYQLGKEKFLGTLEVGKKADITVLNKNLFAIEPEEYLGTKAKLTVFNGKVVYEKL